MRSLLLAAAVSALAVMAPDRARAVLVDGGFIAANGTDTTVDLFDFTVSQSSLLSLGLIELSNSPPPVGQPSLKIYRTDGPAAGTLAYEADAPNVGAAASVNANIDAGSYVMAVSEYALTPGNFGPLNPDALAQVAYQFEFGITGSAQNYTTLACDYAGNLNGTYTLVGGSSISTCPSVPVLPTYQPGSVPEPASVGLLGLSLLGLGLACQRRKAA